jgi:hypothetical protein
MYAHIQIGARDTAALTAFYDRVLAVLGIFRRSTSATAASVWCNTERRPQFVIREPFNGLAATWGNGVQISFLASTADQVDSAWTGALACGGTDEGLPGMCEKYADDFYAAYCRDPEGNKLCSCSQEKSSDDHLPLHHHSRHRSLGS